MLHSSHSLSLLWREAERKELKIIAMVIKFYESPGICPGPLELHRVDMSTHPSSSSDSQVWDGGAGFEVHPSLWQNSSAHMPAPKWD